MPSRLKHHLNDDNLYLFVLPEGEREKFYWDRDLSGYGIRVRRRADGRVRRKYCFQYRSRLDGKQHRVDLGNVDRPGAVTETKARQAAAKLSENVQTGNDPQSERKAARKANKELLLVSAMKYLDDRLAGNVGKKPMRLSSYKMAKGHFNVHWAALSKRPVASITDSEVKAELRKIIEDNGKQAARAAKANLSAFYVWAMREGIAKSNPTIGTHALAPSEPRTRVLNDDEIRAI